MNATLVQSSLSSIQTAAVQPLTPEQVALYQRIGFLNAGQVIDQATVTLLRNELERVMREHGKRDQPQPFRLSNLSGNAQAPVWQIVNIWQGSQAFQDLVHNPRVVGAVQQVTGATGLRIWHDQIQYKPAEKGGINPWHQDNPYWAPLAPADTQITAWIALDDVDDDNGCMSMVPGSHRWGNAIDFLHTIKDYHQMPTAYQGHDVHVVRTPVRAGSMHLHHPYTWHGSHANCSGRPRRAIALHFMTSDVTLVAEKKLHHLLGRTITSQAGEPIDGPLFMTVYPPAQAQKPALASVAHLRDDD